MGCMCMECKHLKVVRDNHDDTHSICGCVESEAFLKPLDIAYGECDAGEVETEDESNG